MIHRTSTTTTASPGAKVTLVGAGGNIGSQVVPHLGRSPLIGEVTLVDCGRYEPRDMSGQDIHSTDVGKDKALVQARRLRRLNPRLRVTPLVARLENVPWAGLRGDVMLAALDSRASRLRVNEISVRLGMPLIDGAVDATGMLARVNVYRPGTPQSTCLECSWDAADYAAVEQVYPCQAEGMAVAPTNAPTSLGAAAAVLEVIECEKILAGQWEQVLVGRQVLIDFRHHKHYVTAIGRNPDCRFDHQVWKIERLRQGAAELTVADALQLRRTPTTARGTRTGEAEMQLAGDVFVRRLTCGSCHQVRPVLRLSRRLLPGQLRCRHCGDAMAATGFDTLKWLKAADITRERHLPLRRLGFRAGDVLAVRRGDRVTYFEIGPDAAVLLPSRPADEEFVDA